MTRMMGYGTVPCFHTVPYLSFSEHSLSPISCSLMLELKSLPKHQYFQRNLTILLEASLPHLAFHTPGQGDLTLS